MTSPKARSISSKAHSPQSWCEPPGCCCSAAFTGQLLQLVRIGSDHSGWIFVDINVDGGLGANVDIGATDRSGCDHDSTNVYRASHHVDDGARRREPGCNVERSVLSGARQRWH
jgi:hypothetical protein